MINPQSYTTEWLFSHRNKKGYERINPPLVEKMIHALSLVEKLALQKLEFIFKGGTSLILLLDDAGRFSIDIDIITIEARERIEAVLAEVCKMMPFTRFELSEHRSYKPGVPKAHYLLFYNSALTGKEDHILLDILYEDHVYPQCNDLPVTAQWIDGDDNPTMVTVPSVESILGDKLTAYAPNTTGILYGKGKEVEIVKQLHDVGKLYDAAKDAGTVMSAFDLMVEKEIKYRGQACTAQDVCSDIIETGLMIVRREKNTQEPNKSQFNEIKRGLLQFKSYQTSQAFRIDEAVIAAGKAAVLAAKIRSRNNDPLPVFTATVKKADVLVQHADYNYLNKLPGEALFYWYHAIAIAFPPVQNNEA